MTKWGWQPLPEAEFVPSYGTEIAYEVHDLENGSPAAVIGFCNREEIARLMASAPQMAERIERLEKALLGFVETIEAVGGVFTNPNGTISPEGEPEWFDLGDAYEGACKVLGRPMLINELVKG